MRKLLPASEPCSAAEIASSPSQLELKKTPPFGKSLEQPARTTHSACPCPMHLSWGNLALSPSALPGQDSGSRLPILRR